MSLADDLVTAGVSAVVSGAAALLGALIGARATRRASADAFELAVSRENDTWRKALYQECLQNINLSQELGAEGLWSFDVRVLRDCPQHAAAFTSEVLQHIIWTRTANEQMEEALSHLRSSAPPLPPEAAAWKAKVLEHRSRINGEISTIEVALRGQ